jgi:hypothetical protein
MCRRLNDAKGKFGRFLTRGHTHYCRSVQLPIHDISAHLTMSASTRRHEWLDLGYVPGRDQLALGRVVRLRGLVVVHVDRRKRGVAGNRARPSQQKVALSLFPLAVVVGLPVLELDLVVLRLEIDPKGEPLAPQLDAPGVGGVVHGRPEQQYCHPHQLDVAPLGPRLAKVSRFGNDVVDEHVGAPDRDGSEVVQYGVCFGSEVQAEERIQPRVSKPVRQRFCTSLGTPK